MTGGYYSARHG